MASLKPIEKMLLKTHIDDLNNTIKTGFYPLNWTSQRIPQYIDDLILALQKFSTVVSQVLMPFWLFCISMEVDFITDCHVVIFIK
jgi:hypothetical protein